MRVTTPAEDLLAIDDFWESEGQVSLRVVAPGRLTALQWMALHRYGTQIGFSGLKNMDMKLEMG